MNSENAGGFALIPLRLFQGFEDVLLLEIVPGLKQSISQGGSLCHKAGIQEDFQWQVFI